MKLRVENFSLEHTLDSGQFFRYEKKGDWYYCHERDVAFRIKQKGDVLEFVGTTKKHVKELFGLNCDYESMIKKLNKDKELKEALETYPGLRVMQRDPWETTVNFQCSIMSNIKKIKKNMNMLAETFGEKHKFEGKIVHKFPKPGKIKNLEKIKSCATGFRAKYIHGTNGKVDDKFFKQLKKKTYLEAKEELMKLPGIGEKVADCICLFALGKTEAFPVDVWIARVMKEQFNLKMSNKEIVEFAQKKWGKDAGYAQQFLYHWSRNK